MSKIPSTILPGHARKGGTDRVILLFKGILWVSIPNGKVKNYIHSGIIMSVKKGTMCKNIVLAGFMATGKTTVGRLLASQLGYEFIDTDDLIENLCGQSIADIFREKGEAFFRTMESSVAHELGARQGLVIATGGGMLQNPANVIAFKKQGQIICLQAGADVILKRIENQGARHRPLLNGPDPMDRIQELMLQRESTYAQFTTVNNNHKSLQAVVRSVMAIVFKPQGEPVDQ